MHSLRLATRAALVGLVAAALVSCSAEAPPQPPPVAAIPVYPESTSRRPRPEEDKAPMSAFAALSDRVLDAWLAEEPSLGRQVGLHEHDGKVAAYGAEAIAARVARLGKVQVELAAVDEAALSPDEKLDLALLRSRAAQKLFQLAELEEHRTRPQFYEELFTVNGYLDRDYAPIAMRAERLLSHEEAALAELPNVRRNLKSPLSKAVVETSIKIYKGFASYLRDDVPKQLEGVGTPAFRERLAKANGALAAGAAEIAEHLAKVELAKGDESHVLGKERYRKLLEVQEGLDLPLADLEKMGEEDLATNKRAFEDLTRKKVRPVKVEPASLFGDATKLTAAARRFLVDRGLVTIPTDEEATVKETPPFMRWNAAFLDSPGVFDPPSLAAFYYITKPDPTWPKKEQLEYLPQRGVLLATTVHEVWPGHFLQGLWARRAPTRAQKILTTYSFEEGWAHYAEQMMIEEGFGAADPDSRLGQLSDALLRDCRVVASLGVHTKGMKLAQAARRFHEDCHQDKATAREQAARATFDPGYFAYTLGKLQILALREEAKKRLGTKFSLKRFHDALLAHGSPPVPLIRERVLADLAR